MINAVVRRSWVTLSADQTPSVAMARNAAIAYTGPASCLIAYAEMSATSTKSVPKSIIGTEAGTCIAAKAGKSSRKSGAMTSRGAGVKCDSTSCTTTNAEIQTRIQGHASGGYEDARQTIRTSAIVAPPSRGGHAGPRKMAITDRPVLMKSRKVKRTLYCTP